MVQQKEIQLPPMAKGFHIIDQLIYRAFDQLPESGLINIFVKHTSAALMINENADPDVLSDLQSLFDKLAPEDAPYYKHIIEGADDMPAHFKTAVLGPSLSIPISRHKLNLGTWQSIYFCEFRNYGGNRKLVLTIYY